MTVLEEILNSAVQKFLTRDITKVQSKLDCSKQQVRTILSIAYDAIVRSRGGILKADDPVFDRLIDSVSSWLTSDSKPWLLFYGGVGTGKTTLARSILETIKSINDSMREWENKPENMISFSTIARCPVRNQFPITTPLMISALQATKITENEEKFRQLGVHSFLIMDDIGNEPRFVNCFGNKISPIDEIISIRYEKMLPTIITTNLNKDSLLSFYGERILDRLEEMCDWLGFNENSYRRMNVSAPKTKTNPNTGSNPTPNCS